jgi:hypothetical protein
MRVFADGDLEILHLNNSHPGFVALVLVGLELRQSQRDATNQPVNAPCFWHVSLYRLVTDLVAALSGRESDGIASQEIHTQDAINTSVGCGLARQ